MGQPKHLIEYGGQTWLAYINSCLKLFCDEIVIAGQGKLPEGEWLRLDDAPGCSGPMAGVLAAMRKYPLNSLIVCACDMPEINADAINWLISQICPDDWAIVPQIKEHLHPLFAVYDPRIRPLFEDLAVRGMMRMREVCASPRVRIVRPPSKISRAWNNINDSAALKKWRQGYQLK